MNDFVATKYGMVSASTPKGMLETITALLRSHVRNCGEYELLCSGQLLKDLGPLYKAIKGDCFKSFLKANYDNGLGRRAGTVRNIIYFLNGQISGRTLVNKIQADERNLNTYLSGSEYSQSALPPRVDLDQSSLVALEKINDYDFYRLLEGIGPDLMSRLMLTFLGAGDV